MITQITNLDSFKEAFLSRKFALPVGELWVTVPNNFSFKTSGFLYANGEDTYLEILADPILEPLDRDQWWSARGLIDDHLLVSFPRIPPSRFRETGRMRKYVGRVLSIDLEQVHPFTSRYITYQGLLHSDALIFKNEGTRRTTEHAYYLNDGDSRGLDSWMGEVGGFEYLFRSEDGCTEYNFRTATDSWNGGEDDFESIAKNMLLAFSWLNGSAPYPWYTELSILNREEISLSDSFDIPYTHPSPLAYHLFNDTRPNEIIALTFEYLCSGHGNEAFVQYLWHYRNATPNRTLQRTNMVSLCSIIEGFVNSILINHFGFEPRKVMQIGLKLAERTGSRNRNRKGPMRKRFRAVCMLLGIQWYDQFSVLHSTWSNIRNDLAHGDLNAPYADNPEAIFTHELHLTTMFNVLAIRMVGYSDPIRIIPIPQAPGCILNPSLVSA